MNYAEAVEFAKLLREDGMEDIHVAKAGKEMPGEYRVEFTSPHSDYRYSNLHPDVYEFYRITCRWNEEEAESLVLLEENDA